jgi:hypothetical protein
MSQIFWIFGSKLASPLPPWPLWGHSNQIAKTKEKTTINTDADKKNSVGYNHVKEEIFESN